MSDNMEANPNTTPEAGSYEAFQANQRRAQEEESARKREENERKESEKFDYYVHLANGDVRKVTKKQLEKSREESGTPHAFRENGVEHHVIGVYPREVEFKTEDDE